MTCIICTFLGWQITPNSFNLLNSSIDENMELFERSPASSDCCWFCRNARIFQNEMSSVQSICHEIKNHVADIVHYSKDL